MASVALPALVLGLACAACAAGAEAAGGGSAGAGPGGGNVLGNPFDLDAGSLRMFELMLSGVVLLFCANFVVGVRRNLSRAQALADALDGALAPQFASVGVAGGAGKRLVRDGVATFWYYATGRLRTSGFAAQIRLRARQDLFAVINALARGAPEETATVLAPIDANMEPLSVLLITKRELARVRAADDGEALKAAQRLAADISDFPALPGACVTMAEHKDSVSAVLTNRVQGMLADIGPAFRSLHVSDFPAKWDAQCAAEKKFVRVRISLPEVDSDRKAVLEKTAELVCTLVDVAVSARIPVVARKKAIELRKNILDEEEKERQKIRREELAAEKEVKRKEKQEAVSKMSREKQIKHEEKMRKKAFKDRLKKVTVK